MTRKSNFFQTKNVRGDSRLFQGSRQVATIWFDKIDQLFNVIFVDNNKSGEFKTFAEADLFAWKEGLR